jgi:ABC-2 type transport system ATP-binding protein
MGLALMTAVIEVDGLRKRYRRMRRAAVMAVDGLDLSVSQGGVYGFLGPNGSGKTTTIRCLLGLVRPSEGTCRLFGHDVRTALPSVVNRVGSIVEAPAFFPTFSGRRNLRLLAAQIGLPAERVDRALDRVGLADRKRDLVKTYSLGMRQRLGIAAALLKEPELLVLDEPANGLDPAGIKEVRELLRDLAAEGSTVFVSSHQLAELQQTCDYVAILNRGRCVASGPVSDILARGASRRVIVRVDDLQGGLASLRAAGFDATLDDTSLAVTVDPARAGEITRALAAADLWVTELRPIEASLEDIFLELTTELGASDG